MYGSRCQEMYSKGVLKEKNLLVWRGTLPHLLDISLDIHPAFSPSSAYTVPDTHQCESPGNSLLTPILLCRWWWIIQIKYIKEVLSWKWTESSLSKVTKYHKMKCTTHLNDNGCQKTMLRAMIQKATSLQKAIAVLFITGVEEKLCKQFGDIQRLQWRYAILWALVNHDNIW